MNFTCPHCDQTTPHRIKKPCSQCKAIFPHIAFYQRSKPQSNKRRRERYAEDPSKVKAQLAKRDALLRGATVNDLTAEDWEDIKRHYGYRCIYCGKKKPLTKDHITPLSQRGAHSKSNVVPACRSCNAKKGKGAVLKPIQSMLL